MKVLAMINLQTYSVAVTKSVILEALTYKNLGLLPDPKEKIIIIINKSHPSLRIGSDLKVMVPKSPLSITKSTSNSTASQSIFKIQKTTAEQTTINSKTNQTPTSQSRIRTSIDSGMTKATFTIKKPFIKCKSIATNLQTTKQEFRETCSYKTQDQKYIHRIKRTVKSTRHSELRIEATAFGIRQSASPSKIAVKASLTSLRYSPQHTRKILFGSFSTSATNKRTLSPEVQQPTQIEQKEDRTVERSVPKQGPSLGSASNSGKGLPSLTLGGISPPFLQPRCIEEFIETSSEESSATPRSSRVQEATGHLGAVSQTLAEIQPAPSAAPEKGSLSRREAISVRSHIMEQSRNNQGGEMHQDSGRTNRKVCSTSSQGRIGKACPDARHSRREFSILLIPAL
jgi:hypothetical protein